MPDSDDGTYRVWPDGTVQSTEDGQPHSWTSDDFMVITASSEEEALALSKKNERKEHANTKRGSSGNPICAGDR